MKRSNNIYLKIMPLLCLLISVGILFMMPNTTMHVYASSMGSSSIADIDPNRPSTGDREHQTNINEPGSADNAEALQELNIANNLTVTYENSNGTIAGPIRILMTLTFIALAPMLIISMTCFIRIVVVLHFTRTALNTQTVPPNQVIIALALFLTFFIMAPTFTRINEEAIKPLDRGELTQAEAFQVGMEPLREFMYGQTQIKDVRLFLEISDADWDGTLAGIPNSVLIPSFMISELRTAFIIGFLIYIPFIIIDMVVASTLMSMGMMMLPPTTISMPFKILLFILADGWNLIIGSLVKTFY